MVNDDLNSPEARDDPHGFFHRLRAHDPIHWSETSRGWILSSHAEVSSAFRDPRLSADRISGFWDKMAPDRRAVMAPTLKLLRAWMAFRDPPEHTSLRDPVRRAFTPRAIERLEPKVHAITAELLDDVAAQGRCDLVQALTFPLPAIVIAELLGVPPTDREAFKTWSSKLNGLIFGTLDRPDRDREASEAAVEYSRYFDDLIRHHEREPGDNLITTLLRARDDGDSLSGDQLVGACTLLLFAGHETTTMFLASAVQALFDHPTQLTRLRQDPAIIDTAVEELMRFAGPTTAMVRVVAEPHERDGHQFQPGQRVYLGIAGANRDPSVFDAPDDLDLSRQPNQHLGFGLGLHVCLGASLARLEGRIALNALLARFPDLRPDPDRAPRRLSTRIGHGITSLPVYL